MSFHVTESRGTSFFSSGSFSNTRIMGLSGILSNILRTVDSYSGDKNKISGLASSNMNLISVSEEVKSKRTGIPPQCHSAYRVYIHSGLFSEIIAALKGFCTGRKSVNRAMFPRTDWNENVSFFQIIAGESDFFMSKLRPVYTLYQFNPGNFLALYHSNS